MTDPRPWQPSLGWLRPRPLLPAIWNEARAALCPRPLAPTATTGTGDPVLLVPGFLSGDGSLARLADYLREAGHAPASSELRRNGACSEATLALLEMRVERLADDAGTRVGIVGHSRGGVLGRVLAHRRPDLISGVVTLASPMRDHLAVHPLLWAQAVGLATLGSLGVPGLMRLSCGMGACCSRFWEDLAAPLRDGVGSLSVYTQSDGVVDWRACVAETGPTLEAVGASHLSMLSHAPTLHAVCHALAGFRDDADAPAAHECPVIPLPRRSQGAHDTHELALAG
jgi:triacylglycerol lipase